MNKNNTQFKDALLQEQKILLQEIAEAETPSDSEHSADENEQGDEVEEFEERVSLDRELKTREHEIESALQKIEAGTYGFCEVCKKEIEHDRLVANPAARTCKEHMDTRLHIA